MENWPTSSPIPGLPMTSHSSPLEVPVESNLRSVSQHMDITHQVNVFCIDLMFFLFPITTCSTMYYPRAVCIDTFYYGRMRFFFKLCEMSLISLMLNFGLLLLHAAIRYFILNSKRMLEIIVIKDLWPRLKSTATVK